MPHRGGIVNFGADHVVVRDNRVLGNDSLGVIVLQNFLASADPRIEPNPDFGQVRGNVILGNGHNPDPVRAITPGADLVYDGTGTATCFADNVFATEFPAGITEQFPCGNQEVPMSVEATSRVMRSYLDALIARSDFADHFTDDVTWTTVGSQELRGREPVRDFLIWIAAWAFHPGQRSWRAPRPCWYRGPRWAGAEDRAISRDAAARIAAVASAVSL